MQGILIKRHSRWLENLKGLYFKGLETLKTPNYGMALMFYKGWILLIPTWSPDFPFSFTCKSKYSFDQWNITSFTLWGSWIFKIRPSYDQLNLNSKSETQDPLTITVIHYLIITNQLILYSIEVCVSLRKEPSRGKSAAVVACEVHRPSIQTSVYCRRPCFPEQMHWDTFKLEVRNTDFWLAMDCSICTSLSQTVWYLSWFC